MKESGVLPGKEFYVQYVRLAIKNGEELMATQAINEMKESGLPMDYTISVILLRMNTSATSVNSSKRVCYLKEQ